MFILVAAWPCLTRQPPPRSYVSNHDENTVTVINNDRDYTIGDLQLAGSPFALPVTETNGKLYMLNGRLPRDSPAPGLPILDRRGTWL